MQTYCQNLRDLRPRMYTKEVAAREKARSQAFIKSILEGRL